MRYYAVFVAGLAAILWAAQPSWDVALLIVGTCLVVTGGATIAVRGQSIHRIMAIGIGLTLIGFALFVELVLSSFSLGSGFG